MQIVVKQSSGLGNQLFQYAAGRCLAKRHGASLRIAHQLTRLLESHGHARSVLLQRFAISAPVREASYFDRLVVTDKPQLRGVARGVRAAFKIQVVRQSPEHCQFHHELRIRRGIQTVYLQGFWHDYSLVREVESDLRRELILVEPLRGRNLEVAKRIGAARNPVSIHLRRGDYGACLGPHMVLPMAYYEHAISHILNQERQSTFFVFSDDVPFARDWSRGDPRFVVVDHNNEAAARPGGGAGGGGGPPTPPRPPPPFWGGGGRPTPPPARGGGAAGGGRFLPQKTPGPPPGGDVGLRPPGEAPDAHGRRMIGD